MSQQRNSKIRSCLSQDNHVLKKQIISDAGNLNFSHFFCKVGYFPYLLLSLLVCNSTVLSYFLLILSSVLSTCTIIHNMLFNIPTHPIMKLFHYFTFCYSNRSRFLLKFTGSLVIFCRYVTTRIFFFEMRIVKLVAKYWLYKWILWHQIEVFTWHF